jgi:hypothetical protein
MSESKSSASSGVMDKVQEFCLSNNLEKDFEDFAEEYASTFVRSLDMTTGKEEHPLEFHDVYREYLSRFERKIERFIEKVNMLIGCTITWFTN